MLDLRPWVARLAEHTSLCALGAAALGQTRPGRDSAYVMPLRVAATEPDGIVGPLRQQLMETVAVVLAIGNRRDKRGEQGLDEVLVARKAVWTALVGWCPPQAHCPIRASGGQLLRLDESGVLWWQDEFITVHAYTQPQAGEAERRTQT